MLSNQYQRNVFCDGKQRNEEEHDEPQFDKNFGHIFSVLYYYDLLNATVFLLAVTSQTVGGTTETFSITVLPSECFFIEVTLEYSQHKSISLLKENSGRQDYHRSVPFKVPVVSVNTVATIHVQIKGIKTLLNKSTEILIKPPTDLTIIETDKPIYKPGQTVLPKFEVTVKFPSVMTILDVYAILKVCAKYTYGKPVKGTVTATVCRNSHRNLFLPAGATPLSNICRNYKTETDATGCGERVINLKDFALTDSRYETLVTAQCEVEEHGTGVTQTGSASAPVTTNIVTLSFEDSPPTFKLGMTYDGKIKVTDAKSNPMRKKVVRLTVTHGGNKHSDQKLVTDNKGMAEFSLNTQPWGVNPVSVQAQYEATDTPVPVGTNQLTPHYPTPSLSLQPFYSKSQSFIKLNGSSVAFSCNQNGVIRAQYMIHNSALRPNQNTLSFFYMVMTKGQLVQQGQIVATLDHGTVEHRGSLVITLQKMLKVTPVAQVVLYTVLPSGEAVADSMNFPVHPCLANK
ncbi:alpha-2-macroglobulin-like protein 1, partial [Clarias magur]